MFFVYAFDMQPWQSWGFVIISISSVNEAGLQSNNKVNVVFEASDFNQFPIRIRIATED